jgi:hypothetical protein
MNHLKIRVATIKDNIQLQEIGKQTFLETFSDVNTEKNMEQYIADSFSLEQLTTELNDEHTVFYFAQIDEKIIGYLKLNFEKAQTELINENALEIERIYILKDFLGQKYWTSIVRKSNTNCSEKKC